MYRRPAAPLSDQEQRFLDVLRAALADLAPARFAVAFSGGLDSTVLLAAMTRLPSLGPVRALHIDHALYPDSAAWARHCRRTCAAWAVPFDSVRVSVGARRGVGLEAAARAARYAALAELLEPGEILLTAHHADDQLETLLLRLLRGAGVRGMRGILPRVQLGAGAIARPLLDVPRAGIRAQAERWKLDWLEDPSNRDLDRDRNLLRAELLPVIRSRWGESAAKSANRLAAAMRDAEEILGAVAASDLAAAGAARDRIPLGALRALTPERQRNALRHAIRAAALGIPEARHLEALRGLVAGARPGGAVRLRWPGGEARIYRDRLYLFDPRAELSDAARPDAGGALSAGAHRVSATVPWSGPQGRLLLEPDEAADERRTEAAPADAMGRARRGIPESWARQGLEVRFRAGGERFKPAGERHHRSLKHWFQQRRIVPWMRARVPLLYRGDRLVAVADLALADEALHAAPAEGRWRVRWLDHPRID